MPVLSTGVIGSWTQVVAFNGCMARAMNAKFAGYRGSHAIRSRFAGTRRSV